MRNQTIRVGQALTPREWDVLRAYAINLTTKDAARSLGISVQTVKNHLANIYFKLGVNTALAAMHRVGWLWIPGVHEVETAAVRRKLEEVVRDAEYLLGQIQ